MYPITETFYINNDLFCVVEPIVINGKQSTNWLGEVEYKADRLTGNGKSSVAVTLSQIKNSKF